MRMQLELWEAESAAHVAQDGGGRVGCEVRRCEQLILCGRLEWTPNMGHATTTLCDLCSAHPLQPASRSPSHVTLLCRA